MSRKKLVRFEANSLAWNVIEEGKPEYETIAGNWNEFLSSQNSIVVELGCGRGEYSVGLGKAYSDKNFIGVDIKGNRIWKGSQQALEAGLKNVAFLRTYIQNIETYFEPQEIDEIWITFPDPRPRGRDEKRRLTHERFLQSYFRLLKPNGIIHLKTDHIGFYEYTLEVLSALGIVPLVATSDLYNSEFSNDHLGIKTHYESLWTAKGSVIKYLRFQLPSFPTLPSDWNPGPYPPVVGSTSSYK